MSLTAEEKVYFHLHYLDYQNMSFKRFRTNFPLAFLSLFIWNLIRYSVDCLEESSRTVCGPISQRDELLPVVPKFTGIEQISDYEKVTYKGSKRLCNINIYLSQGFCANTEAEVSKTDKQYQCECLKCADDDSVLEKALRTSSSVMKYMTAISIYLSRYHSRIPEEQLRINWTGPQVFQNCQNTLGSKTPDPKEKELYDFIINSVVFGTHPKLYKSVLEKAQQQNIDLAKGFCLGGPTAIPHLKCLIISVDLIKRNGIIDANVKEHNQYCYFWSQFYHLYSTNGIFDLINSPKTIRFGFHLDPTLTLQYDAVKIISSSPYLYFYNWDTFNANLTIDTFALYGSVCSDKEGLNIPCDKDSKPNPDPKKKDSKLLECKMGICGGPDKLYERLYTDTHTSFNPGLLTQITANADPSEGIGGILSQLLQTSERIQPSTVCSTKMWDYAGAKDFEDDGIRRSKDYGTDDLIYRFEIIKRTFKWRWKVLLKEAIGIDRDTHKEVNYVPYGFTCIKHGFEVTNLKSCREFAGTIGCLQELPSMTCVRVNQDDKCICRDDPVPFNYKKVNEQCVASENSVCTTANGQIPCVEGTECKVAIPVEDELPSVITPFTIKICMKISKSVESNDEKDGSNVCLSNPIIMFLEFIILNVLFTIN